MPLSYDDLNEAVIKLKEFHEVTGREDLIRQIFEPAADSNSTSFSFTDELIQLFMNVTDGALFSHEIDAASRNLSDEPGEDPSVEAVSISGLQVFDDTISLIYAQEYMKQYVTSDINTNVNSPSKETPVLSLIQVFPANITPAVRFTDACALFLTAIPTIELSRAVPYLDIRVKTPRETLDEDGKPVGLSIYKFLQGENAIVSEKARNIIQADEAIFTPDSGDTFLYDTTAGMELFTSPQTLTSGDEDFSVSTGVRTAPVIDRFRPLMSIKSLDLNVVPTHGMMSYKSAKLSLVLHDRSRLGEIADLIRPDLYSRTELLITYGWSHPDNTGENAYGTLINAMRTKEKYGVVNSSFVFGESGQVDITLELFMKGVVDFSTAKITETDATSDAAKEVEDLLEAIATIRTKIMKNATTKEVRGSSIFSSTSDLTSALSLSKDAKKEIQKFLRSKPKDKESDFSPDTQALRDVLVGLYGEKGTGSSGAVYDLNDELKKVNQKKLDKIKNRTGEFDGPLNQLSGVAEKFKETTSVSGAQFKQGYVSLAKLFANFVGEPLVATGRYDEVQILFYAFNSGAGAMRTSNIGSFPIKVDDFTDAYEKLIEDRVSFNLTVGEFVSWIMNNFIDDIVNPGYGMSNIDELNPYKKVNWDDSGDRKPPKDTGDQAAIANAITKRMIDLGIPDGEFLMPQVSLYVESIPKGSNKYEDRYIGDDGPTILKIHIIDKHATPHYGLKKLLDAMLDKNLGTFGEPGVGVEVEDKTKQKELAAAIIAAAAESDGVSLPLIEKVGGPNGTGNTWKLTENGTPAAIKRFVAKSAPTLRYGTMATGIKQASVSSLQEPLLNTVHMQRAGLGDPANMPGVDGEIVPLQVLPTELNMSTFGCPLINFGQQFFVDFDTGTTVDNIYGVVGLTHRIEQGRFDSTFKLINIDAYGKFRSMFNTIQSAISVLDDELYDPGLPPFSAEEGRQLATIADEILAGESVPELDQTSETLPFEPPTSGVSSGGGGAGSNF